MNDESLACGILVSILGGRDFLRDGDAVGVYQKPALWSVFFACGCACLGCSASGVTTSGEIGSDTIEEDGELEKNETG